MPTQSPCECIVGFARRARGTIAPSLRDTFAGLEQQHAPRNPMMLIILVMLQGSAQVNAGAIRNSLKRLRTPELGSALYEHPPPGSGGRRQPLLIKHTLNCWTVFHTCVASSAIFRQFGVVRPDV